MYIPAEKQLKENVYLIGIYDDLPDKAKISLDELKELVQNLGLHIKGTQLVKLREPHAQFLLGSGKVDELIQSAKLSDAQILIFDRILSPAQQRNWEKESKLRVMDRHEIILNIFDLRAKTREARLQVELAQLEYLLPRLKRMWTHLERQRGGAVKMRGVGETQIELDERMIRNQIKQLKSEIEIVMKQRATQRKQRLRIPLPAAAIVGYTNAGKSSLLNKLAHADLYVANKLFATLDPTTKRVELPTHQYLLITDTVGFIQNLPHSLIDAFKATLEESILSDFLIHVVDINSPYIEIQMETTLNVLKELGAPLDRTILVFNKIDLLSDDMIMIRLKAQYPHAIFISTINSLGINLLYDAIHQMLTKFVTHLHLLIPYSNYHDITELHEIGAIEKEEKLDEGLLLTVNLPNRLLDKFKKYKK